MEKRRNVSLGALLWRYLILTGVSAAALAAAWWITLMLLMNAGFVLPARTQSDHASDAAAAMRLQGSFDASLADELCNYVYFAPDGTVLETNLSGRRLADAKEARRTLEGGAWFYQRVDFSDGSLCLFQFDYSVLYGNEALRGVLPDFELASLVLLAVVLVTTVTLITRHYTRRLRRAADKLAAASARIAEGQLEGGDFSSAGVRELDGAMDAMRTLKENLSGSLQAQWRMEQQRAEQMAALAHDLKTPLTIIGGNAELLAEDALSDAQRANVDAILRNTRYAGEYIASLRALAAGADSADTVKNPEPAASDGAQEHAAPQETERVSLPEFLAEIQAQGQALCRARGCVFRLLADGTSMLPMRRAELLRALVNLVENAARYTPRGGAVTLGKPYEARPGRRGPCGVHRTGHGAGLYARGACQRHAAAVHGRKKPPARRPYGSGPDVCRRCRQASRRRAGASQCGRRRSGGRAFISRVGMTQTLCTAKEASRPAIRQGGRLLCAGGAFCFSLQKSLTWSELQMLCLLQSL